VKIFLSSFALGGTCPPFPPLATTLSVVCFTFLRATMYKGVCHTTQEFSGNVNNDKETVQFLRSPIIARYVRIHPVEWRRQIGLRAGLLGCPQTGMRQTADIINFHEIHSFLRATAAPAGTAESAY